MDTKALALALKEVDRQIEQAREEFEQEVKSVTKALGEAEAEFRNMEETQQLLIAAAERKSEEAVRAVAAADALIHEKIEGFEFVSHAWADYELAMAEQQAEQLLSRLRPAARAADEVRAKGAALAELRRRAKLNEWIVKLYEFHYPWLEELRSFDEEDAFVAEAMNGEQSSDDPVRRWLRDDEWTALPEAERNQRALERYLSSTKSPWQVGRDYERYIGYLREQDGYTVTYHGIIHGFEDLGRDVIAEKNGSIEVIQCKRWAQHKEIHEKHVFQLFGTMTAARIENPGKNVTGTFTTTTGLSERARQFAVALDIKVEERFPLSDYPRIKCNVGRRTSERIYHLPFDQQYDSTVIETHRGERWVTTCAEAEADGFRRAWRWREAT